jgi:hypothetical protein
MNSFTDVGNGNVPHYSMDSKTFEGFVFPTRRRVVSRGESSSPRQKRS